MTTLNQAFEAWFLFYKARVGNNTSDQTYMRLATHIMKDLGDTYLYDLKPIDFLNVLKKMEDKGLRKSVGSVKNHLNRIYEYAIISDQTSQNPIPPLTKMLKKQKSIGMFFVEGDDLLLFLSDLSKHSRSLNIEQQTLIWLWLHTAKRRSELVGAVWSEFDLDKKLWTIPAERMKTKIEHVSPISDSLLKKLITLKKSSQSPFLFPSPTKQGRHLHPIFLNQVLINIGWNTKMSVHGIRKIFSTYAHESGLFSIDAIETQLSHEIRGVRGVYNKAVYLSERKKLVNWWSKKLDELHERQ